MTLDELTTAEYGKEEFQDAYKTSYDSMLREIAETAEGIDPDEYGAARIKLAEDLNAAGALTDDAFLYLQHEWEVEDAPGSGTLEEAVSTHLQNQHDKSDSVTDPNPDMYEPEWQRRNRINEDQAVDEINDSRHPLSS